MEFWIAANIWISNDLMSVPLIVEFEDDFIGYGNRPEWSCTPAGMVTKTGQGGIVSLKPSLQSSARMRLGEDGKQPGVHTSANWHAKKNPTVELMFYLNTLDCEATLGLVGEGDGYTPASDFVALYRSTPTPNWSIQTSNVVNGGILTNTPVSYIHTPGTWTYFRFELSPGRATFVAYDAFGTPNETPQAVIADSSVPYALMFFEAQAWSTASNPSNVTMNIDWIKLVQAR